MNDLIPLFVALPLGTAFVIPMFPRKAGGIADLLGNAVMLALAGLSFLTVGQTSLYRMGGWAAPLGIDLRLDALSSLMLITVNVIGLLAAVYSVSYMRLYTSKRRYFSLFLFMVAGMNGVVLTGDLFNLYVFMEIAAIASYALVGFGCGREELEASFKYMVLGGLASAFILMGVAFTYGMTGTLNMAQAAGRIAVLGEHSMPLTFALGLFICGFGVKAALVPFHAWLPDAHPAAPAPISAMLSGVVIKALGVYSIARLLFNVFALTPPFQAALQGLGVLSMVIGVLLALGQWDMKRLFAYHSISQIGYVVLGLGLGTPLGIAGGIFHLVNHAIFKSLLFLNAGAVEYATGTRQLKRLGGLAGSMPVTGKTSLVASLSISGIPPFNGFWSKLLIIFACVQAGAYWMAAAAVIVSLLTLASFLKVQRYAFFEQPKARAAEVKKTPFLMGASMVILALLCLVTALAVAPGLESPFLISGAAEVLLRGAF